MEMIKNAITISIKDNNTIPKIPSNTSLNTIIENTNIKTHNVIIEKEVELPNTTIKVPTTPLSTSTQSTPSTPPTRCWRICYENYYCRQKYLLVSCFTTTLLVMIYFLVQIMTGLDEANIPLLTRSMDGINNKLTNLKLLNMNLANLNQKLDYISNTTTNIQFNPTSVLNPSEESTNIQVPLPGQSPNPPISPP